MLSNTPQHLVIYYSNNKTYEIIYMSVSKNNAGNAVVTGLIAIAVIVIIIIIVATNKKKAAEAPVMEQPTMEQQVMPTDGAMLMEQ